MRILSVAGLGGHTMLTLYFAPGPSSFAVHIALHEIGVPFEGKPMSFDPLSRMTAEDDRRQNRVLNFVCGAFVAMIAFNGGRSHSRAHA